MTTRQKALLLAGLLIGWILLLGYRIATRPGIDAAGPRLVAAGRGPSGAGRTPPGLGPLAVRLDLLKAPRPEPPASPKNLFAGLVAPRSPAPPPPPEPPPPPPPAPPPPPSGPTPEELERQRVTKELGRYRYLGYLQKGSEQEGFLSTGDELLTIHPGETVPANGRYRIVALTDETLTIRDPQTGVETTLTLTGK